MTIETPYRRSISTVGQTMPYQLSTDLERYALFALKTHLWEFMFEGEMPVIRSVEIDGWMVYVVDVYKADVLQTISNRREKLIKTFIDRFTILHPSNMFCRVFTYTDSDESLVKSWVYPDSIKVKFEDNHVYVNLYDIPNYSLMYDQINISLHMTCNNK